MVTELFNLFLELLNFDDFSRFILQCSVALQIIAMCKLYANVYKLAMYLHDTSINLYMNA